MRSVFTMLLAASLAAACSQPSQQPGAAPPSAAPPAQGTPGGQAPAPAAAPETPAPRGTTPASAQPAPPASTPAAAPSTSAAAPPPSAPTVREVTIPSGASLSVKLSSRLASNISKVEDPVQGTLAKAVVVDGATVVPAGSEISGSVIEAKESGRVKGRASIAFRFDRLVANGETYRIQTARVRREAAQHKSDDVKKGGIGAGVGAVVGGLIGGGKGAVIGGAAGGTGAVLATKGREVELAPGTVVTVSLQEPVTVPVPVK